MSPDELRASMLSKGLVECADGSWSAPSRTRAARNSGPTDKEGPGECEGDRSTDPGELPHPEQEEQQAVADEVAEREDAEEAVADYETGVSTVDGEGTGTFRIDVVIHVSNRVRRDPTGALETICDIITATRRRLGERLDGRLVDSRKVRPNRRRRDDNDHKDFLNPPF